MSETKRPESFGNTFLGVVLAVTIGILLFGGEPDVADAIREKALQWAGMEQPRTSGMVRD